MVCERSHFDSAIRRSLAHLVKSCQIEIVPDGFHAFEQLLEQTFNLIIIDAEVEGIDGLELAESVAFIDPGVPVILMLKQAHRVLWGDARALGADPILRPFKPLTFLRLVDTLLHQHLERYRFLSEVMAAALEELNRQPDITCAFLLDDSGQRLMSAGSCDDELLAQLSQLACSRFAPALEPPHEAGLLLAPDASQADHRLCVVPVIETLWLALLTPSADDPYQAARRMHHLTFAAHKIQAALAENSALAAATLEPGQADAGDVDSLIIPLQLEAIPAKVIDPTPPDDDDEDSINWQILANTAILDRLQTILAD
jgi:CheY-like chemotaxis protein